MSCKGGHHLTLDVEAIPEIVDLKMERGLSSLSGQEDIEGAI